MHLVYFGEILSLVTAVIWAFAVILFRKSGKAVHPIGLNLFKNLLAFILFIPTILLLRQPLLRHTGLTDSLILVLSGVIGIGIGDTLFFLSLNLIGAGLSAIVESMYSPFIILLSVLWLGEHLTIIQVLGTLMVVSAVLTTAQAKNGKVIRHRTLIFGIINGVLATVAMAVGVVMIKPILVRSSLLWATELRLLGGIIGLLIILSVHPKRRKILLSVTSRKVLGYTISGSFIGAYLAMFIWLAGMKYANVSIASVLNQTSNIFVFIFAAIILKEHITLRKTIAITLAVSGAFLVFIG
ncbi:MAG: hypothetical protein B5M53_07880 [Candidatus Cloacimonas sp. 4484_209]|nr:MAG: hypothetical protein B5M53_07880 [Candidatus Cloacimonas sp. 4484_209]